MIKIAVFDRSLLNLKKKTHLAQRIDILTMRLNDYMEDDEICLQS